MEKFLINISEKYKKFDYYDICYKDFFERNKIKTIIFFTEWNFENTKFCEFRKYLDFEDLKKQVLEIWKQKIFYINTFDEHLILEKNLLQKELWFNVSDKFEIFRNKDLQRKYLLEKFPETTVNYQEINFSENEKVKLDFPCMIKPTSSAQSSGVTFLKNFEDFLAYKEHFSSLNENLKNRWYGENKFILEEFIDWEMYTINYFVNEKWEFFYAPIVKVNWISKLWIDDFSNYVRISWELFEDEIDLKEVLKFIKKHIKTFGLKNTFVHHEFKKTSKWELKTIELNWRIWGYRLELYEEVYGLNMFDLIFWKQFDYKTDFYYSAFVFYSEKEWIFKWIDKNLEEKILWLNSFLNISKFSKKIWKKIWLAKNAFWSVFSLKLRNNDKEQFEKDFDFIEKNYKNVLIVE